MGEVRGVDVPGGSAGDVVCAVRGHGRLALVEAEGLPALLFVGWRASDCESLAGDRRGIGGRDSH